ncbi:glycosyltransferase [Aestuariimicrobium kwangyangense]|uniref:glycosyltransferase n=1 Tax=Aestuariimicrobium kwangyangense TaxID=396389 RepID=UPI0003B5DB94|nr:glycosyltransferase [Aestuariimicrobium kwangyangense]
MSTGVVVVSYGSSSMVDENLSALDSSLTVVLVDNFSGDQERRAASALAERRGWQFIGQANVGFGGGVNAGCRRAVELGCTSLVLLNPDASATSEALERLAARVEAEPDLLVSPRIVDADGEIFYRGSTLDLSTGHLRGGWVEDDDPTRTNWLSGACLAFSSQAFERLHGMRESLFLYWEDVDFSWRATRAGLRLAVLQDVVVTHDEGSTHGSAAPRNAKSDLYYYWNTRNRLAFAADNLAPSVVRAWLRKTPAESAQIWLRGGRRQLLHHPAGAWAAVRGTLAGIRLALPAALPRQQPRRGATASRMRRRVLVAHPSPDLYGSDRVLLDTVQAFVRSGDEVTVALPSEGPLVAHLESRGASVVGCPSPVIRKSALSPGGFLHLVAEVLGTLGPTVRLLRRTRPDLVFVNTVTIPMWQVIPKFLGKRVVCHVHEAEGGQRAVVKKLLYAPLLVTDHLVVNSRYALEVLAGAWPSLRRRSTVVDNPVPGPPEPAPLRETCEAPRLLFIGRLSPRKGPQVALAALRRLHDAGVPAHLDLLGAVFEGYEWFERELHEQVSELHLDDHVRFLGFRPDVWSVVASADIVVVPSVADEPFGNTAVEAILAGRPVVVSDTSGLREAAGGYRWARRVTPNDPQAIADAVVDIVGHWDEVRESIDDDTNRARTRHAPDLYQGRLVEVVGSSITRQ